MTAERLSLRGVSVIRAGAPVVDGVDLDVAAGEVVALIGSNGAGKTSLLEAISGATPSTGEIVLNGLRIDRLGPTRRARAGIAHVEQGRTIFSDMTVEQNLMVVADRAEQQPPQRRPQQKAAVEPRRPIANVFLRRQVGRVLLPRVVLGRVAFRGVLP